jgi:hypothetical protein
MTTSVSRKIERYARVNGISYQRAAAILGAHGAARRKAKARRKTEAQINDERFERMRESRPDLYA